MIGKSGEKDCSRVVSLFLLTSFAIMILTLIFPSASPTRRDQPVIEEGLGRKQSSSVFHDINPSSQSETNEGVFDEEELLLPHRRRVRRRIEQVENIPILPERVSTDEEDFTKDTGPAIIIGLSSSIIVCALLLYAHDLNDRMTENKEVMHDQTSNIEDKSINEAHTSAASTEQDSGYWISTESRELALLPPMNDDGQQDDDLSIDRVSTLTQSCLDSIYAYSIDDKLRAIETSSQVTELSEENLVSRDTDISSLVLRSPRQLSSTSDGEDDFEEILRIKDYPEELPYHDTDLAIVALSPNDAISGNDTSVSVSTKHSFAQLGLEEVEQLVGKMDLEEVEQMVEGLPSRNEVFQDSSSQVLRDIYFVPGEQYGSLGLGLASEEFPTVFSVAPSSPLAGKIFCGDSIVAINTVDLLNESADVAMTMLSNGSPVKITVKSVENDDIVEGRNNETEMSSFDLGEPETCVEL